MNKELLNEELSGLEKAARRRLIAKVILAICVLIILAIALSSCDAPAPASEAAPLATTSTQKAVALPTEEPNATITPEVVDDRAMKLKNQDCVDPDLASVKKGTSFMLCNGEMAEGTYEEVVYTPSPTYTPVECEALPDLANLSAGNVKSGVVIAGVTGTYVAANESHSDCTGNGQTGCIATSQYKSADLTNLAAGNIKSGVSIAGQAGNLIVESHSDCGGNAQIGCITTATWKSASFANLTAGNIKKDAVVAGVTGGYPSSSYPMTAGDGVADLDTATFDAKIKSDLQFGWFDANGTRYAHAGSALITPENLKKDVVIFNALGTIDAATPEAWDIRKGVVVNGTTGQLDMRCSNSVDGIAGSAHVCTAGNWQDLTPEGCTTPGSQCQYLDRVSGFQFSFVFGAKTWLAASSWCVGLYLNGYTGWRLPAREELQQAAIQRLTDLPTNYFYAGKAAIWSKSPAGAGKHYAVDPTTGDLTTTADTTSIRVICVK